MTLVLEATRFESDSRIVTIKIYSNLRILIFVASETTSGVLHGITNYTIRNQDAPKRLGDKERYEFDNDFKTPFDMAESLSYLTVTLKRDFHLQFSPHS